MPEWLIATWFILCGIGLAYFAARSNVEYYDTRYATKDQMDATRRDLAQHEKQIRSRIDSMSCTLSDTEHLVDSARAEQNALLTDLRELNAQRERLAQEAREAQAKTDQIIKTTSSVASKIADMVLQFDNLIEDRVSAAVTGTSQERHRRAIRVRLAKVREWRRKHEEDKGDWDELIKRLGVLARDMARALHVREAKGQTDRTGGPETIS